MTWLKDTAERVIVTFFQAWLSAWIVIENATANDLFGTDVLTIGLLAAVGSLLKALAATRVGNRESASLAA
jgi:hypothetical protein